MSLIKLYKEINFYGIPRVYEIDESKYISTFILYKDFLPLTVRSIINTTKNYYVYFYYASYFSEFGGNYFIIQNHEFSNISKINNNINYDIIQPFFNGIALVHKNDKSTYLLPNTLYNSWNPFFNYKIYADLTKSYQSDYLTPNNYVDMTNKYSNDYLTPKNVPITEFVTPTVSSQSDDVLVENKLDNVGYSPSIL